jgi:hypothetical protein
MDEKNIEEFKRGLEKFIYDLEVIRKEDDYKYSRDQLVIILKELNPDSTALRLNKGSIRQTINTLLRERNLKRSETRDDHIKFILAKNIFKDGSCIYVISDMSDKIKKYKVGFSRDINNRLSKEKIFTPNFKLEFLTYSNCDEHIEKMVNLKYLKNSKSFMGSNWIYEIDISHITESIKFIINFLNHTCNIEVNISKYN